jgi:DNA-binding response OmpR family regulator
MPPNKSPDTQTILVVDDTPMNLQVLVGILEGSEYRILAARNGRVALEIARRVQPDLVLLDVAMPEMDGFEVCRALKQDPTTLETIVIFLSARGEVADKVSGLELGAADYITKPFQSEEVLAEFEGSSCGSASSAICGSAATASRARCTVPVRCSACYYPGRCLPTRA